MIISVLNTKDLFDSLDSSSAGFIQQISSLNNKQINALPFKDSWNVGQLTDHVTKSIVGIAGALNIKGKPADRNPAEREEELEKMFLNFGVKYKSPAFILPAKLNYNKKNIIKNLQTSVAHLKEESNLTDLSEAINHPAFGEITKLELLHFTKFHMQRHLHQLKNIFKIVKKI